MPFAAEDLLQQIKDKGSVQSKAWRPSKWSGRLADVLPSRMKRFPASRQAQLISACTFEIFTMCLAAWLPR